MDCWSKVIPSSASVRVVTQHGWALGRVLFFSSFESWEVAGAVDVQSLLLDEMVAAFDRLKKLGDEF